MQSNTLVEVKNQQRDRRWEIVCVWDCVCVSVSVCGSCGLTRTSVDWFRALLNWGMWRFCLYCFCCTCTLLLQFLFFSVIFMLRVSCACCNRCANGICNSLACSAFVAVLKLKHLFINRARVRRHISNARGISINTSKIPQHKSISCKLRSLVPPISTPPFPVCRLFVNIFFSP